MVDKKVLQNNFPFSTHQIVMKMQLFINSYLKKENPPFGWCLQQFAKIDMSDGSAVAQW